MLCRYLVDDTKCGKLVDRLSSVLSELDENLESNFNLDNSAKDVEQLTDALSCLELHSFVFFWLKRIDILNECLRRSLIQCSVVQE